MSASIILPTFHQLLAQLKVLCETKENNNKTIKSGEKVKVKFNTGRIN